MKWDEDVISFSNEMWRTIPLDLRVCLIREEHIDPDDDDANDDDADLSNDILGVDANPSNDISPASAAEPGWGNDTSTSASAWSNATPGDDDMRAWATWTTSNPEHSPFPTPYHDCPSFINPFPPMKSFPRRILCLASPAPVTKRGIPRLKLILSVLRASMRIGRSVLRRILRRLRLRIVLFVGILLLQSQIWVGVMIVHWWDQ